MQGHLESVKISIVDTDDLRPDSCGGVKLFEVVSLDESVEAEFVRDAEEFAEPILVKGRDDQKDRVRTGDRRVKDLRFIDDEILPQDR